MWGIKINGGCVHIPKLQSILQQIHVWRLGNIRAQLDHRKKERVEILTLGPQALEEKKREKNSKSSFNKKGNKFYGLLKLNGDYSWIMYQEW